MKAIWAQMKARPGRRVWKLSDMQSLFLDSLSTSSSERSDDEERSEGGRFQIEVPRFSMHGPKFVSGDSAVATAMPPSELPRASVDDMVSVVEAAQIIFFPIVDAVSVSEGRESSFDPAQASSIQRNDGSGSARSPRLFHWS